MGEFQKRNPNLYVFSAHLHMDEQTTHLHIDFVPYVRGSKRGLETRVSFRGALHAQGFPGGSRSETERNQWMEAEKKELAVIMERYGVKWLQKGTHEKHLSVLDFKKQEREKEIAALDIQKQKTIEEITKLDMEAASRQKEFDDTMYRQLKAEAAVIQAGKEEIELRQENSMLSKENGLLKAENGSLAEECERLGNQNQHLHQIQKYLKTENQELAQEYEMLRADHLEAAQEYEKVQSDIQELTQERVKQYVGAEQIDEILGRIKDQEHMKRQQKRVHCMER